MSFKTFRENMRSQWVNPNVITTTDQFFTDVIIPQFLGNKVFDINNSDKVATVFTCVRILSDTISRLPLNVYVEDNKGGRQIDKSNSLYPILHYQPNLWTSSKTFFQTLEYYRNLKGNAFARIYRNGNGQVTSLDIILPQNVLSYEVVSGQLYYKIKTDNNKEEVVNASDILHFKAMSRDGIWGMNPIEALRSNISSSYQGLNAIDNFYKNNAMSPKYLKSTVNIAGNQKAALEFAQQFADKYSGTPNAGKMSVLPPNTELATMDMNLADAQLIETLKFNTTQISALYGVPAHMVGILESTKFASVEQTALDFKVNTISAIGREYRQQLEMKLLTTEERMNGVSIEFQFEAMLETDSTTRINNLRSLSLLGVLSPNQIAAIENYPTFEGGDKHSAPQNFVNLAAPDQEKGVKKTNEQLNPA